MGVTPSIVYVLAFMGELSWSDRERVAELTKGQRDNHIWKQLRQFRLTGSNFGKIYNTLQSERTDMDMLRSGLWDMKDLSHVPAIQWGTAHEQLAINAYQSTGHLIVNETGLWLFGNGCLGASPDGLVYDGLRFVGILEVKCPYKIRDLKVAQDKDLVTFLPFMVSETQMVKTHDYYHQIQAELYATGAQWCDFFVWTPNHMLKVRIYPDQYWVSNTLPAIQNYFINNILRPNNNPRQLIIQIEILLKSQIFFPIPCAINNPNTSQIMDIAKQTIGQYYNPKWLLIQPGLLSANLFYTAYNVAIAVNQRPQAPKSRSDLLYWTKAMFNYKATTKRSLQHGSLCEPIAIKHYERLNAVKVVPTGMWMFPDAPLYAAPDGLIYNDNTGCKIFGILEVKCPTEINKLNLTNEQFPYLTMDGHLRNNSQYYFQVQGHLAATGAHWCDFVIWAPNYYHQERIYPDLDWQSQKLPIIKSLVLNKMLPLSYSADFLWEQILTR